MSTLLYRGMIMKDLRFSIAAVAAFVAFSLYLIGTYEADDSFAASLWLPVLSGIFFVSGND